MAGSENMVKKSALLTVIFLVSAVMTAGQSAAQLKRATELFNQGTAAYKNEQWDQAIRNYTEYLKIRPTVSDAWFNRGLARKRKGSDFSRRTGAESQKLLEEATADFTQAIKLNPGDVDAWTERGDTYLTLLPIGFGKYLPLALSDFSEAIKRAPKSPGAYRGRGMAYDQGNEPEKALADFNQAIRLDPQHADSYFRRGKIYYSRSDWNAARSDFEAARNIAPSHPYAQIWLDSVAQKLASARTVAAPAPLKPETWQSAFESGSNFLKRNQPDQAIASFQAAIRLLPTSSAGDQIEFLVANQKGIILENIAKAHLAKKDYDGAIRNCITAQKTLYELLAAKTAGIEKYRFDPAMLAEVAKSKLDLQIMNYDILLSQATEQVEIGKRCLNAFPQSGLTTQQTVSLIGVGLLKTGAAEFVADLFYTNSALRLALSQICRERGKNLCGETSRNNEIAKYANKSLDDINKAIEIAPALKKLYLHRAGVYRFLGKIELAEADEATAQQKK
jgi:tetratricopeptide (TPR) repeat protein